jgi:hypothetical protein
MTKPQISLNSNATPGHQVIEKMVNGYATQNLDAIMELFDDNAVYKDLAGRGEFGNTKYGAPAIKRHFAFYFKYMLPSHTYEDTIIVGEGNRICASWTLVLGSDLAPSRQHRVRGCDFFIVENGKVIDKNAFLKFSIGTYLAMARIKLIEAFSSKSANTKAIQP